MSTVVRMAVSAVLGTLVCGVLGYVFFAAAGGLGWIRGWGFVAIVALAQIGSALYVSRKSPGLLTRRAGMGSGTKRWDVFWLAGFGFLFVAVLFAAAFEHGRRGGEPEPLWTWCVGAVLYLGFVVGLSLCQAANPFFEKTIRIQEDQGHRVIDSGPYRYVRHPGYAFTMFGFIPSVPLLLGSWQAFVPAAFAAAWLVVRTGLEDRTLRRELDGYEDYAGRVRYRLVPGVW